MLGNEGRKKVGIMLKALQFAVFLVVAAVSTLMAGENRPRPVPLS
jgi:hypothetical protein